MISYRKVRGEWVAFGPVEEIQPGPVQIVKRSGAVCERTVERVEPYGRTHALGHLAEHADGPTYRQRREARAERLRGWADKREVKAAAELERAESMASVIPFGQPILVGHHSEGRDRRYRDRIGRAMDRAIEDERKAEDMTARAETIEAQLAGAIYDDDPDAIARLTERVAALETKRAHVKEANAAYRAAHRAELSALTPYGRSQAVPYPSYVLANLSGNITRNRQRLARLTRLSTS